MPSFLKSPWFWLIIGVIVVICAAFYAGRSWGESSSRNAFDNRQAELLKKSQEADARAEKYKAEAEANEKMAARIKEEVAGDRKNAEANEQRIEADRLKQQQEINARYENELAKINDPNLSACDRCRDLCARANRLVGLGPEFAGAACDPSVNCAEACASADPAR